MLKKDHVSYTINYAELMLTAEPLGAGAFGVVYKGSYRHNDVAVKQLLLKNISEAAAKEFEAEAAVMAHLRAPNIVQFYGYCISPHYCIVMEYMPNGSLFSVLHSNKPLDWPERFQIAVDIAKGLAFLHHEKILHRDVKSLNVLLDKHYQAKLTDFGLSKVKTETTSYHMATKTKSDAVGTIAWMAPELFGPKAVYTPKADIYSLGVTFWELAARQVPFKDATDPILIPGWVKEGHREDIPSDCPPELAGLIAACWEGQPDRRPTADEVVNQLKKVIVPLVEPTTNAPANPLIFSGPHYQGNLASEAIALSTPVVANTSFTQELQEIEFLLKKASVNEKTEEHEDAEKAYQAAIKKVKESNFGDDAFRKVYVAYGEYLLRQNKKAEGDKQFRIAVNFGYIRPEPLPAPMVAQKPTSHFTPQPLIPQQPSPVVMFTPSPVNVILAQTIPQVNAQELSKFLKLVAEGEQDQAEAMLKANKDIALLPGDVTDLSKRIFKNITALQYALWALDWHMWTMLLKYLSTDQAKEQAQYCERGSWVAQHGVHANWDKLTGALDTCIQLINQREWDEADACWVQQVGGAQLLLPAHVINEYCHPTRSFDPCPDFTKPEQSGAWRSREVGYNKEDWNIVITANGSGIVRGQKINHNQQVESYAICDLDKYLMRIDAGAMRAMYKARTQQRSRLLTELTPSKMSQLKAS